MEMFTGKEATAELLRISSLVLIGLTPVKTEANEIVVIGGESVEAHNQGSEQFVQDLSGKTTFLTMPNGVVYLDEAGAPLAVVPAQVIDGINPGAGFDADGNVDEGYYSGWKEAARTLAAKHHPAVAAGSVTAHYNWLEIQSTVRELPETDAAEIDSVIDIVYHHGNQTVPGTDETLIQYIERNIDLSGLPDELSSVLEPLIAPLAAHESRFNDGLESRDGAVTRFQFMPQTINGLGYDQYLTTDQEGSVSVRPDIPLPEQLDMVEQHFGNIYTEVTTIAGDNVLDSFRQQFASESDFNHYFLGPVLINAYVAGGPRMAHALGEFASDPKRMYELHETHDGQGGFDVFYALTEFAAEAAEGSLAEYREESQAYTNWVYAYYLVLLRDQQTDAGSDSST